MVTEVKKYLARDGETFSTMWEAEEHEVMLDLADAMENSDDLYFDRSSSQARNVAEWLLKNYRVIKIKSET